MNEEMENGRELSPEEELNALSEGDIIEMVNDDGETVSFIFIDALEYEGGLYLALAEPDEDDTVFFLKTMKERGISQYKLIKEHHISTGQLDRLRKNENNSTPDALVKSAVAFLSYYQFVLSKRRLNVLPRPFLLVTLHSAPWISAI